MTNNSLMINVTILTKSNCSTYDPCGPHGYCENNAHGELKCVCKFWWEGSFCDELSGSGNQVIILGVITAFLVMLYYGLPLFRWITKRRIKPMSDNQITILRNKSSTHTQTVTTSSRRILPWVTVLATIILASIALFIKWIILKDIHQEIITKFHNNQSLFYNRPSICRIIYMRPEFNMFTFPIACLLIFLFIIITKRESSGKLAHCKGYFSLPIPLDFFAHIKRTFAAVTFAIVADELSNIANQFINGNGSSENEGVIINYTLQIVRVLIIGFRCYPILAAVYINTRFTLICASLYAWFDFSITVAFVGVCRNDYYSTQDDFNKTRGLDTQVYLDYYGTGSKLVLFQLLTDIPRYFFLSYICVELSMLVFKRMRYRKMNSGKELTCEQKNLLCSSTPDSIETKYVESLFGLREKIVPTNRLRQLLRFIYEWRDDFRFSSRVICVYASVFFLLFFLTVQACVQVPPYLGELLGIKNKLVTKIIKFQIGDLSFNFPIPNLIQPYFIAIYTALIIIAIQLIILLGSIRRNLLQVFRGDNSEIPRFDSTLNVDYASENIHFAGYLIGYVLWGYILVAVVVMIIALLIDIIITYELMRFVELILKMIIPPILFAIFQYYFNKILSQYVFLQQSGDVLSIHHRRILMIFLYFNFFLDAFLGFISSIIRILKSTIGGILYMCRLDYSSVGRKLETFEAGFSAYCGFIHMECAHRHPVLLYFTSLLIRQHLCEEKRCSKARQRWYLAIFLLKNPTLIYRRKRFLTQSPIEENKVMLIGRKNRSTIA